MNTKELDLSAIRRGDRITFRAATRESNRKATRMVTSVPGESPWVDHFTVKGYNGWADFAVRPHEVIEHHPVCETCGSEKPADRSCGCFDNGGQ